MAKIGLSAEQHQNAINKILRSERLTFLTLFWYYFFSLIYSLIDRILGLLYVGGDVAFIAMGTLNNLVLDEGFVFWLTWLLYLPLFTSFSGPNWEESWVWILHVWEKNPFYDLLKFIHENSKYNL